MKSFGTILKEAREAKGLTCSQVAHDTHMLVQIVEDMEREEFGRIPASIYGRGFVRLYAERVGLDPAPLISEFMDIYNGKKPKMSPLASSSHAPVPPPPPPPPAPAKDPVPASEPVAETAPDTTEIAPEPPPRAAPSSLFTAADELQPSDAPGKNIPESLRGLDLFDPASAPKIKNIPPSPRNGNWESPYASAYSETTEEKPQGNAAQRFRESISVVSHGLVGKVRHIPHNTWRVAVLAGGVIAIIALIAWGCAALYKATSSTTDKTPAPEKISAATEQTADDERNEMKKPEAKAPSANSKTDTKPKTQEKKESVKTKPGELRSTGPKIEPLYID